ncbi:glycerol-3-phosphate O-acyltransferase [Desarmillaria tabescens]|uniref:Glycerol-3-phosphate O-acyltransferase n=1 Tax=Armillaria tabescens TaxID=1929756 RepID=A0AA39MQP7_ARMTA|nr:glycerol-3-phosphate O-acyltransferase [Desarmillaria tabescens]KAK0443087.1 glycerol-3-phosphate O-acyltransferase [Desarmillaria tabescens]
MTLKLVYRILRKLSDWTVDGFYSEVYVEGAENVPKDGPLIIAATHHNEIIDVAALAVTIPYRRHLCFWAKSTLFSNPIFGSILASSGAIPVTRNPNRDDGTSKAVLFQSTTAVIAKGEVAVGQQWAAVEYTRWCREHAKDEPELVIVPVGLVYTDKDTFKSRARVHYGPPISMADYTQELFDISPGADPNDAGYAVVHNISNRIEKELFDMTINANDWETLFAAQTARAVLWGDDKNVDLKNWRAVSQTRPFVIPSHRRTTPRTHTTCQSLLSLNISLSCTYTGLSHAILESVIPSTSHIPSILPSLKTVLLFPVAIPAMLLHIPACIMAELTLKLFAQEDEWEGFAQYRSVGGGIGGRENLAVPAFEWMRRAVSARNGKVGKVVSFLAFGWTMIKWYGLFSGGIHQRPSSRTVRIVLGILLPPSSSLKAEIYKKLPPPPPSNAFIRRRRDAGGLSAEFWDKKEKEAEQSRPPPVASRKLVRQLLEQRKETMGQLSRTLVELEGMEKYSEKIGRLREMGAKIN